MIKKAKGVLRRIKKLHLRNKIRIHEKRVQIDDNEFLKYLFFHSPGNKDLIVVFSGMSKDKAKYNYLNTLSGVKADKLFILDDFGEDKLGCYYLCVNNDYYVEFGVKKLIQSIVSGSNYNNIFFVGSSKGGWASLYYGLDYPESKIIIGAPQYYLGQYLLSRKKKDLLFTIAGKEYQKSEIDKLDTLIKNKIEEKRGVFQGKVFIHYSNNEHTYHEHVSFLLSDLKTNNYSVEEEVLDYRNHDDVAAYYPSFLLRVISCKTE